MEITLQRVLLVLFLVFVGLSLYVGRVSAGEQSFSYDGYADVLNRFVDDDGMVAYKRLKKSRTGLDGFVTDIGAMEKDIYRAMTRNEKVAFWVNAYNAFTLKAIIDHYPIKASGLTAMRFPKDSIRQISGVWDGLKFSVMGRDMTLDYIEHKVLRKLFKEPGIHMALVCASMSCPSLRNEPFYGERLGEQLEEQAKGFLRDPKKFKIDRGDKEVHLSQIFKWFGNDFKANFAPTGGFKGHDKEERASLNYISQHIGPSDAEYLRSGDYDIEYLDYDWSLNQQ